ncbi:MAG: hypothetical protein P4M15_01070 [Alphaproteobacteria bacterium]|nr:hypothetical protein [Alphaproteobacteria bacterium]
MIAQSMLSSTVFRTSASRLTYPLVLLPTAIPRLNALLATSYANNPREFVELLAFVLVSFGAFIVGIWALRPRKVVFLTAQGLRAIRETSSEISWRAIRSIDEKLVKGVERIVVETDPAVAPPVPTLGYRWQAFSRYCEPNELLIQDWGLEIGKEELLSSLRRYWEIARTPTGAG